MAMIFNEPLDSEHHILACDRALTDPERLNALRRTGLMDTEQDPAFDRLAHLAAKFLKVPLTIISLVGDKKQFFKAAHGLHPPFDVLREIPIEDSICRFTLLKEPIIAGDVSKAPSLKDLPAIEPWGIVAFIALPLIDGDGHVLGAFCAIDTKVRSWLDEDILLMRELTASVMTEINLRMQVRELKAERALREKVVAALSHDLRNPLSVAKMGAEILRDNRSGDLDRASYARIVCDSIGRADKMIQDLLTASRIQAGETFPLDKKRCDIVPIVRAALESLSRLHRREFSLTGEPSLPGHWDSERILRILENLVGNAVKYGVADRPVTIALSLSAPGDAIELSVHNEGPPIPEADIEMIFDLFQRSEASMKGSWIGWGIGLTVVRALTEEMGGKITVQSRETEGTTFTIRLPKD